MCVSRLKSVIVCFGLSPTFLCLDYVLHLHYFNKNTVCYTENSQSAGIKLKLQGFECAEETVGATQNCVFVAFLKE